MNLSDVAKFWTPIVAAIAAIFAAGGLYYDFQVMKERVSRLEGELQKVATWETKVGAIDETRAALETMKTEVASLKQLPSEVLRSGDRVKILLDDRNGLWIGASPRPEVNVVLSDNPSEVRIKKVE